MTTLWLRGLLLRRSGRMLAAAAGVAIAVALFASLGSFLTAAKASMTQRASHSVAVDWQVQVKSAGQVNKVLSQVRADVGTQAALPVGFAQTTGLAATTAGTTQTTGPGRVLGTPAHYTSTFPAAFRLLTGRLDGALLAQQTAANLHAGPGDTVQIGRAGMKTYAVKVAGVIEIPQADSLFQQVGAPSQSQPIAPPDNVVVLPSADFSKAFGALAHTRPDLVSTQIHTRRSHHLPNDPAAAFTSVTSAAHNLEAQTAGAGVVGNNLGAALDAAREDALYSQILFLFLGAPGAVLAAALTAAVATSGRTRRRHDQALLRVRGATSRQLGRLLVLEALLIGVIGGVVGLGLAFVVGSTGFGSSSFGGTTTGSAVWAATAVALGLVIALAVVWLPARRDLAQPMTAASRSVGRAGNPRWMRFGLDLILIATALVVFWITSRSNFTLVLAPEGVPTLTVDYWAFLAPGLAWTGAGLFAYRVWNFVLSRGRPLVSRSLRPAIGNLAPTAASMMARQRSVISHSCVLVGLALAFAMSTATFNATYRQQAEIDAQLTNGADVTVTESPGASVPPSAASAISNVPGVNAVEPLQHRFAYVGSDLQDIYGINPTTIERATTLQDPYFQGGTASAILNRLATTPNGVLVSAETVLDYQLKIGDLLKLRLQDTGTQHYITVPFHYVGIVNEFPTAPKDSFLVANASYLADRTGSNTVGAFLVDTGGTNTQSVATAVQNVVGSNAHVTDLSSAQGLVGTSLTSVDLSGLSRIELIFALLIVVAAGGLVTGLGLTDRRRSAAIVSALGATPRQVGRLTLGEPAFVVLGGLMAGALTGTGLSMMLVKILTGVFDPPPAHLAYPSRYLVVAAVCAVLAVVGAAVVVSRQSRAHARDLLHEL